MPLELGIDIGCKAFHRDCSDKSFLIFDSEQYRFQQFVSDLSGQDIHQHGNSPKMAVARFVTGSAQSRERAPFRAAQPFMPDTRPFGATCPISARSSASIWLT
jgi:hypothetical protein